MYCHYSISLEQNVIPIVLQSLDTSMSVSLPQQSIRKTMYGAHPRTYVDPPLVKEVIVPGEHTKVDQANILLPVEFLATWVFQKL